MDNRIRVVTLTEDKTLGKNDSGSLFVLHNVDGLVVTLPKLSRGLFYDFVVRTTTTGTDEYEIVTHADNKIRGVLVNSKNDTASKAFVATASDKIAMDGGNKGGAVGTHFRITADDARWNVYGQNTTPGTEATPFA